SSRPAPQPRSSTRSTFASSSRPVTKARRRSCRLGESIRQAYIRRTYAAQMNEQATIAWQHSYAGLPAGFGQPAAPTPVAAPRLLAWNAALANQLGLDPALEAAADRLFSGNEVPAGARPIALA